MLVSRISFTPHAHSAFSNLKKERANQTEIIKNNSQLEQFAYQDFNINFGARLFRTPVNFYAQKFNQEHMPITMKNYLEADFEDRQNMPPEQLMREAFIDLKYIDSLDEVSEVESLKDEPLFSELTNTPNRKAQTGIIFEIQALEDELETTPLFKDGSSNLGLYVLRKIYLEGKTLKEINKDFQKDLADDYKGLVTSKIDSYAIKAYGIKYPESGFWNSFYPTRKEFPYEYKPRKVEVSGLARAHEASKRGGVSADQSEDTRPPKFKIDKDFKAKAKKMGDAIINGHGNTRKTEKELRSKGISDAEELSFVSKYLGPIMSIALENIHASDEMRTYFSSYDDMTKSQKQKMESYWRQNPHMKELQSTAISDTIKLFYEAYGADGNNDVFRDLLAYAKQIKPSREEFLKQHDIRQQELNEIFADYDLPAEDNNFVPAAQDIVEPELVTLSEEEQIKLAEAEAKRLGAEIFTFNAPNGDTYKYIGNVNELFEEQMHNEFSLLPNKLVGKFIQFARKSPHASYEYKKTAGLLYKVPDFVIEQLMPIEDCKNISMQINADFDNKYGNLMLAGEQALVDVLLSREDTPVDITGLNAMQLINYAHEILKIEEWNPQEKAMLEKSYDSYSKPIDNKAEIKQIIQGFVKYLTIADPDSKDWEETGEIDDICALLTKVLLTYPKDKAKFEKQVRQNKFIEQYGGTSRMFLNPNISDSAKKAKAKQMVATLINSNTDLMLDILTRDRNFIRSYVKDPKVRFNLEQEHLSKNIKQF